MKVGKLIHKYRQSINPPYSRKDALTIAATLLILIAVPLTVLAIRTARSPNGKAATASVIELGVDAYTEHIASEPSGLTYVYKYVTGQGWQPYVSSYISAAYSHGFKPVIVFYTNFDSTTPDFVAWDQVMSTIKADGREVWVVVEPDMWGYIRNNGQCASLGKPDVDRFLSTKATNAHLGFFMSPWDLPYVGAAADAQAWKTCWQAAGGDRMEDIYVDVSDRDQEFDGDYPWSASKITMFEDWFQALHSETGRKISVWQIPMGNSTCSNGRRSNLVETWLTSAKLTALSPYVNRMLFGPGIETGSSAQSWNLSVDAKYDCGFFNGRVTQLSSPAGDTTPPVRSNGSPSGALAAGTTQTSLSLSTDEAATCKYATSAGVSYSSMSNTFSTTGGTSHSTMATGLTNGGSYKYYVRCQDKASPTPNANTDDYLISFTVNATPTTIVGDLNGDTHVNATDLGILVNNWGPTSGAANTNADINNDGSINIFDLSILLTSWGT